MGVRLATQIFSNAVVEASKLYRSQKCQVLEGCEEMIKFCKRLNDLFDALNRQSPKEGLTPNSKDFKVLEVSLEWLNRWELGLPGLETAKPDWQFTQFTRTFRYQGRTPYKPTILSLNSKIKTIYLQFFGISLL